MSPEADSPRPDPRGPAAWHAAARLGVLLAVGLRLGLGAFMAAAWITVRSRIAADQVPPLSLYGMLPMPVDRLGEAVLGVWARWDAVQHLNLAIRGYADMAEGASVFFPLFAVITRAAALFTGNYIAAGLLVATVASAFAFALLMLLGEEVFGAASGRWAAVSLAVYPMAVFLAAPFTESLFLALTLAAFLAAYRMQWYLAAVLAALASLTRAPGLAAPAAFAVLAWQQWRGRAAERRTPSPGGVAVAIVLPLVAAGSFLAWRASAGFAPLPVVLETYVRTTIVNPVTGLLLAIRQWIEIRDLATTLDILSAAAVIAITLAMAVRARWRRPELLVYMAVNLVVLFGRQTEGAPSLKSLSRYVLVLFPVFLVIGDWLASSRRGVRFAYLTISSSLLLVVASLYVFWWFVG
jgi:hypothetical protein